MRVLVLSIWKPAAGGVVTHVHGYTSCSEHSFTVLGYPLELPPLLRAGSYLAYAPLRALLLHRSRSFDVVHAHYALPQGAAGVVAGRLLRTPLVVTLHGTDVELLSGYAPMRWLLKALLRRADAVTAVSAYLARRAEELFGVECRVVYGGVRCPAEVLPLHSRRRQVLFAGSLSRSKGADLALEAFSLLAEEFEALELVFAGAGGYGRALRRMCRRLGLEHRVRFAGVLSRRELEEHYATSLALLMPSRREGFGLAVLEAMAHGTPPVVSSAGGLAEAVENRRSGMVVEEPSPESLAEALEALLGSRELWERLSRGARERAEQFTWERTAAEYSRLYREVTGA